jgi:hypothetical protein
MGHNSLFFAALQLEGFFNFGWRGTSAKRLTACRNVRHAERSMTLREHIAIGVHVEIAFASSLQLRRYSFTISKFRPRMKRTFGDDIGHRVTMFVCSSGDKL